MGASPRSVLRKAEAAVATARGRASGGLPIRRLRWRMHDVPVFVDVVLVVRQRSGSGLGRLRGRRRRIGGGFVVGVRIERGQRRK